MTLAAQWGQPVAPKMIVAEATVESSLDPLAIHDNTTGRTYHPASQSAALQIASQLERAGSDFDAGLMQINCRNFDWLHLTIAGAFDPRRSIEAGAAVLVSMSRYNTGGLGGLHNGYVDKVLASGRTLKRPLASVTSVDAAAPAPIPPAPPVVVLDMLHATEGTPVAAGQVINLLGGIRTVTQRRNGRAMTHAARSRRSLVAIRRPSIWPVKEDFVMSSAIASASPTSIRRALQAGMVSLPLVLVAVSAHAQTVSGAVDPATGINALSVYMLTLVAAVMVVVAAWKGTHAFMEGRSIGPTAVGLLAGLVLAFGGYYILQKYGVNSTTGA